MADKRNNSERDRDEQPLGTEEIRGVSNEEDDEFDDTEDLDEEEDEEEGTAF
jgi:hypothetical protein